MKKVYSILIALIILGFMEGVAWLVLKPSGEEASEDADIEDRIGIRSQSDASSSQERSKSEELVSLSDGRAAAPSSDLGDTDPGSFPPSTTEFRNGKIERTIHMGVRQYAWEPSTINAKKGELVRLVVHNADVKHGLVIPDLGVMEGDIPPEGAVIEFTADKVGTFEFFCSVYCGEGHMEMRGKIVVQ